MLSKPFAEIAQYDFNFRQAYEAQQEFIADWMVSQKAFKELAIQLGAEKGMSHEEVIALGLSMKDGVLNNQYPPEHRTNAESSPCISSNAEKLKAKLKTAS